MSVYRHRKLSLVQAQMARKLRVRKSNVRSMSFENTPQLDSFFPFVSELGG